jgi:HEAT repeat protein
VFLDPDKLLQSTPAEVLDAASRGHVGLDHRFLHAILDRPAESLPAVVAFAARNRNKEAVDLAPELIAFFRTWKAPEGIPFLIRYLKEDPENVPDDAIETLVTLGHPALEPLLKLHDELDESEAGEIAFILANLRVRDQRILEVLLNRLEYDFSDALLLLGMYGDPAAIEPIEKAVANLGENDDELKKEAAETVASLKAIEAGTAPPVTEEAFDIWPLYPARADLPVDMLDEDERTELLSHPVPSVRAVAANSFFNHELTAEQRKKLLNLAQTDSSNTVRARAWEALIDSTSDSEVVEAMLTALRKPGVSTEERGGLLVGLSAEADRNEVRDAIIDLYKAAGGRAKALEAMWRSMHPSFRDYFAKHLEDPDLEVRRGAVWGVGYYGIKSELEALRKLFEDEELRSDAIFAYALALPGEVSRGRMKGLLARIEKDARGLSEMEEELVKAALDERLMLAGKEPVFRQQED